MSCKKCKTSKCTCETSICINPLIYALKNAFALEGTSTNSYSIKDRTIDLADTCIKPVEGGECDDYILNLTEALVQTLHAGLLISNNKEYCCPDCKNGVYFLGNTELYLKLSESCTDIFCCVEQYNSIESYLKYAEAIGGGDAVPARVAKSKAVAVSRTVNKGCCDTDFTPSFQEWIHLSNSESDYFYLSRLLELGMFESSSFNSYSGVGILINYLKLNHPELTGEDYLNILGVISKLGIVVYCNGCEMIISSVDTFTIYAEAIGLCGGGPLPA
jgi:hypothetical protein